MFWKFTLNNSHIDTLLDNEDATLRQIMDEEDVLQECKGQNKKLIDFLLREDIMEQLIVMITTDPPPDCDERTRYKYPNLACELLTCDLTLMNERLSSDEYLLNKLYCFLEKDAPLNPLLASFFSKVLGLLIARKSEDMVAFIKKKEDFVDCALNHLCTSAIMDLILRLTTCIECPETRFAVMTWLNDQQLISKLIALIDNSVPEEKHFNVSQLLCDMIRAGREQLSQLQDATESDPLLDALERPETIRDLLIHMLDSEEKAGAVIVNGISVLQTLLEFRKSVPFGVDPDQVPQFDDERHQKSINVMVGPLVPRLEDLHQILLLPPKQTYSVMSTTIGTLSPPLGNARLQIARLIATVVGINHNAANTRLHELGTINVLLDLYHEYVWNNFLHTHLTHCIASILSNEPSDDADTDEKLTGSLLKQLLTDCKLVEKILEWWDENEQIQLQSGGHRRGYMGHLTKTANDLLSAMEKGANSQIIKDSMQELSSDYKERWETFINGPLAEINKKNTIDLVGPHPLQSSSEDDDADFRGIPFPNEAHMQQAFSDYQLQQMTSSFIDQFGFNEEEFGDHDENVNAAFNTKIDFSISTDEEPVNAAMFEQACNERIQQFDDPDSDEDIWEERELSLSNKSVTSPAQHLRHAGQSDEDSSDEDLDSPAVIRQTPSDDTPQSIPTTVQVLATTEQMDIDTDNWVTNSEEVATPPVAMDTTPVAWTAADSKSDPSSAGWASFDKNATPISDSWADFNSFTSMDTIVNEPASGTMEVTEAMSSRLAAYAVSPSQDVDMNTNGSNAHDDIPDLQMSALVNDNEDDADSMAASGEGSMSPNAHHTLASNSIGDATHGPDLADNFNFLASSGLMKLHGEGENTLTPKSPKQGIAVVNTNVDDTTGTPRNDTIQ